MLDVENNTAINQRGKLIFTDNCNPCGFKMNENEFLQATHTHKQVDRTSNNSGANQQSARVLSSQV